MSQFEDDHEKTLFLGPQEVKAMRGSQEKRSAYLITINGRDVGRMYKLPTHRTTLGRAPDVGLLIEDEGVSRRHAFVERTADGYVVSDNNSTNGVFVNGERITERALKDGDRVQIGSSTILRFSFTDEVEEKFQQQLYDSATRDPLTECYNRKYFTEQLNTEFAFAFRHKLPLSLLLFDIDHFKKLNDGFGHLAGDFALKTLSNLVRGTLRTEDVFARYGGEEFGIILRDTDSDRAFLAAERVRRGIERHEFQWEGKRLPVTISVGVATLVNGKYASPKQLVTTADEFLYKAKHGGRNRTESDGMG